MTFLLGRAKKWGIYRLLIYAYNRVVHKETALGNLVPTQSITAEEARNRPNIDGQEKIHRGIFRGLRNISETP
jgi:hypothetical protein